MLGHLPFLLRPDGQNRRILTIGLGTGILAAELLRQSDAAQVTCVELSPAVIEAAREFDDLNDRLSDNPRATIIRDDGIHFLRARPEVYDAIVSDAKSRPGSAGNASFYSADYYSLCRSRLAPGGLFLQWVSLQTPPRELRGILRAFVHAFPHCQLGVAPPDSLYLVGGSGALHFDARHIQRLLDADGFGQLRRYGWRDACDILGLWLADRAAIERWLPVDEPLNTLDRPVLEFSAIDLWRLPARQRQRSNLTAIAALADSMLEGIGNRLAPAGAGETDDPTLTLCRQAARQMLLATELLSARDEGWFEQASARLQEGLRIEPRFSRLREMAADLHLERAEAAEAVNDALMAIEEYRQALRFRDRDIATHRRLAELLRQQGALSEAAGQYYRALDIKPDDVSLRLEFGYLLALLEKPSQAASQFRQILREHPDEPRAHLGLGLSLLALRELAEGRRHLLRAVELSPELRTEVTSLGVDL
jgi:spermidine synthase